MSDATEQALTQLQAVYFRMRQIHDEGELPPALDLVYDRMEQEMIEACRLLNAPLGEWNAQYTELKLEGMRIDERAE